MTPTAYASFLGVAVLLAITPGPDTMVSLRYAVVGRRSGLSAATGTSVAIFAWAALVAVGVAALLRGSELVYDVLRALGGMYLAVLGARAIANARRGGGVWRSAVADEPVKPELSVKGIAATPVPSREAFFSGAVTCLTNPKTGLFFIALFPQFTPSGAHPLFVTVILGGTVAVIVYAYLIGLVLVAEAAYRRLARPDIARKIEAVSGSMLIMLGLVILIPVVADLLPGYIALRRH